MSKKSNNGHGGNGNHANYPGRPHRCEIIPDTKACKKCRTKGGMLCKNCTAYSGAVKA